jgi:uncharacterized membrane protein
VGIAAIVLGVMGRRKVARGETTQHRGIATGGLVTGIISTVLGLVVLIAFIVGIAFLSSNSSEFQQELERQQDQLQAPY